MDMESFLDFINWFDRLGFQWSDEGQQVDLIGPDGWRFKIPKTATMKEVYFGMMVFIGRYEDLGLSLGNAAFERKQAVAFPWLGDIAVLVGIHPELLALKRVHGSQN